tara:strand:+ start:83 stop:937 length:855 start_codon:yes stop_codon:yes gene_type:complete
MPNTGFLGWAYVTGSVAVIGPGNDGRLSYYDGTGTTLNDAAGLYWDDAANVLQVTGNLDISGAINAYEFNTIVVNDTTYLGTTKFGNDTADVHQFTGSVHISGATNALITESGRVGIGTVSPGTPLDVQANESGYLARFYALAGNQNAGVLIRNGDRGYGLNVRQDLSDAFVINEAIGETDIMTFTAAGLVGIGTTSPNHTLSVTGTLGVSGNTTLGDAVTDATAVTGSLGITSLASAMGFGNPSSMSTSTTVPTNHNFRLFGPITISSGVEFTVGTGAEVKII